MRLAGFWTTVMAIAITVYGCLLFVMGIGDGSPWLWLVALPAVFVGLQVICLPVVLFFEVLEKVGLVRGIWRPLLHEICLIGILLWIGWCDLSAPLMAGVIGFFGSMYLLRILCFASWSPGEPREVGS